MDNGSLPLSKKRRYEEVEIIEPRKLNDTENEQFKQDITRKVVDSLPKMLDIAQTIVDIKKMQVEVDGKVQLLREQGELLQKEADAFVKKETAYRDSFRERASQVQNILRDLYLNLNHMNNSDEVKKVVIDTVNHSIEKLLESE